MRKVLTICSLLTIAGTAFSQNQDFASQLRKLFGIYTRIQWVSAPIVFTPDGASIATVDRVRGYVRIWDAWSGDQTAAYGPFDNLHNIICAISPDGGLLAIGLSRTEVGFLDLDSGKITLRINVAEPGGDSGGSLTTAAFSPSGDVFATGTQSDRTVKIWNVADGSHIASFGGSTTDLSFHASGRFLAFNGSVAGASGGVHVWDLRTGRLLESNDFWPRRVLFNQDGTLIAHHNREGRLWSHPENVRFQGRQLDGRISGEHMAISPDGRYLASGNSQIGIFEAGTGKLLTSLHGFSEVLADVAFSPEGTRVAAIGVNGMLAVWGVPEAAAAAITVDGGNLNDALIRAVDTGNADEVKALIDAGADVNWSRHYHGRDDTQPPLERAAALGNQEIVRMLIRSGADPDEVTNGWTADMRAAEEGHQEVADLLQSIVRAEQFDDDGPGGDGSESDFGPPSGDGSGLAYQKEQEAKLYEMAAAGDLRGMKDLLASGVDVNARKGGDEYESTALIAAAGGGHEEAVKVLLEAGADPQLTDGMIGYGPLHYADHSRPAIVELLLDYGADPDGYDVPGGPPLIIAAKGGHSAAARLLVAAGADIDRKDDDGNTIMRLAIRNSDTELVRSLLEMMTDVNARDDEGDTALTLAAKAGEKRIVELLLGIEGIDLNKGGPLVQAAYREHWEIADLLLENGADINVMAELREGSGIYSPLSATIHENTYKMYEVIFNKPRPDISDINAIGTWGTALTAYVNIMDPENDVKIGVLKNLIASGADLEFQGSGWTALMAASWMGLTETVRVLLDAGATVSLEDWRGRTALALAEEAGNQEIVELLGGAEQGAIVASIEASSALTDARITDRYSVEKAFDNDPMTSWVEGRDDSGIGERIVIRFVNDISVDAIEVMPGYFDERFWVRNNRVSKLNVQTERSSFTLGFDDEMSEQMSTLDVPITFKEIVFTIDDVYVGISWDDTCIAEIAFFLKGERIPLALPE